MAISKTRAEFACDIETVWDTVTSLTDYTWRSDVKKIRELRTKGHFIEYRKNGIATKFSTTKFEPLICEKNWKYWRKRRKVPFK